MDAVVLEAMGSGCGDGTLAAERSGVLSEEER